MLLNKAIYRDLTFNRSSETIFIIAPHCDDELLSCGGIIQQAIRKNHKVKVIFMTNGDGFRLAAISKFKRPYISSSGFKKLGIIRQQEAISAGSTLGLTGDDIFFLGYPDRGLANLWNRYWSKELPYLSKFTRTTVNPYTLSFREQQQYSGENLINDLEELLLIYQPKKIFLPSPYDNHPDHWASYNFIKYALVKLKLERQINTYPQLFLYLIHWNIWPLTLKGIGKLTPPQQLVRILPDWYCFYLDKLKQQRKLEALKKYNTQIKVIRRYLMSFIKSNEIYVKDKWPRVRMISHNQKSNNQRKITASKGQVEFFEADKENKRTRRNSGGDINYLMLGLSVERLLFDIKLTERFSARHKLKLRLFVLEKDEEKIMRRDFELNIDNLSKNKFSVNCLENCPWITEKMVKITTGKKNIKIEINEPVIKRNSYLFINVKSYYKNKLIDRVPWKVIKVN